jgi:NADH dehydrogenase FAD-containing subunit
LDKMDELGIQSTVRATALEVRENGVLVRDGEGMEKTIPADTVVNCLGMKARRAEVQMLREAAGDIPVFEIGDCVRAAKVGEAVQEGYTAALSII